MPLVKTIEKICVAFRFYKRKKTSGNYGLNRESIRHFTTLLSQLCADKINQDQYEIARLGIQPGR